MAFVPAQLQSAAAEFSLAEGPRDVSVYPPDKQGELSDSRGHARADQEPAVVRKVARLKNRSEFLAVAATGRRWVMPAFVLQVGPRPACYGSEDCEIGLGFTATKRIGNAVSRNRAKRRLREAARELLPDAAVPGHDYVLIARAEVLTCAYQTIVRDLEMAFARVLTAKVRPNDKLRPKPRTRRKADPS